MEYQQKRLQEMVRDLLLECGRLAKEFNSEKVLTPGESRWRGYVSGAPPEVKLWLSPHFHFPVRGYGYLCDAITLEPLDNRLPAEYRGGGFWVDNRHHMLVVQPDQVMLPHLRRLEPWLREECEKWSKIAHIPLPPYMATPSQPEHYRIEHLMVDFLVTCHQRADDIEEAENP